MSDETSPCVFDCDEDVHCDHPRVDDHYDDCPEHGRQRVVGYAQTRGSDPYGINILGCQCYVADLGDGNVIVAAR